MREREELVWFLGCFFGWLRDGERLGFGLIFDYILNLMRPHPYTSNLAWPSVCLFVVQAFFVSLGQSLGEREGRNTWQGLTPVLI